MSMKEWFMEQGLDEKAAEAKAARIFNATRKRGEAPVTGTERRRQLIEKVLR